MLERLVASNPPARIPGSSRSAAVSVVLHGVVIVAAVAATRALPPAGPAATPSVEFTVYLPEPARTSTPGRALPSLPALDPGTVPIPGGELPSFPVTVPVGVADPGPAFRILGHPGTGRTTAPWPFPGGTGEVPSVVSAAAADEAPEMLTHPPLEYPTLLREAGLEGRVLVELIVDSTGVAEAGSFRVVSSTHPGFEAAARRALLGARFRPGRWRGRPVRVLIRQPVEFRLRG